ncbi:Histidine kinase-, DNA gyrase B-, and HSP90 ATPase family protein [Trifolium repens]|nr:Histidine kinase-, DNA gyrase B-, and HSP90 ATPase family protein [Trifolium repens]
MDVHVKEEAFDIPTEPLRRNRRNSGSRPPPDSVIELSSSSSSSDSDSDGDLESIVASVAQTVESPSKKRKVNDKGAILPAGFLSPLPPPAPSHNAVLSLPAPDWASSANRNNRSVSFQLKGCKQFWKAGDYDGTPSGGFESSTVGMDHVRVHPKFLHSNATSHKWALGAFAELLDNALDEVCNGATHVNVDMVVSKKDNSKMLLVEDNGGGMNPDKIRQCMSLGYSEKSKLANTIGQYGNGFKTSTMRLGADVIVFSRCKGKDGKRSTQSIGLLSYTFLRNTGKEDIVVPMLDYERDGQGWKRILRTSQDDWNNNVETIVQWSPFSDEADLLRQFNLLKDQGTRVIIYNLWEDDQGQLELNFDDDPHDIQIRGVNRDEKNIQMARSYPNSTHFLTYRHSLRSYASILYLRFPRGFRIILRGEDVLHHNIVNDMMMSQEVTYRPQSGLGDGILKDSNMVATVTIGFVKDAKHHIDVSGFNVYHKNRLIKPFWRIWNPAGSGGRGVIGVLEANFVEPAHDKQGFERTLVLSRLEQRLIQMQKTYWGANCHKIGYTSHRKQNGSSAGKETSPDTVPESSRPKRKFSGSNGKATPFGSDKQYSDSKQKPIRTESKRYSEHTNGRPSVSPESGNESSSEESSYAADDTDQNDNVSSKNQAKGLHKDLTPRGKSMRPTQGSNQKGKDVNDHEQPQYDLSSLEQLRKENRELKERLQKREEEILSEVSRALQEEKEKCKSLETRLREAEQKIEDMNREQESIIDVFSEERDRRNAEEKHLRMKLQEASNTIQELLEKVRSLERKSSSQAAK